MPGPEFGPELGKFMLVLRALYGMKLYVSAYRYLLDGRLHDLGYRPSISEPDVWIIPALKQGGFMYYEYVIFYVDDVLCISDDPLRIMKRIQAMFKLKGRNIEEPDMYLGADLSKMTNIDGQ